MKKPRLTILLNYAPAILWGIFLTVYTLLPAESLPKDLLDMNDKLLHLGIYFFSASLIYLGSVRYNFNNPPSNTHLLAIVMLCTLYGGLIELLQHYLVSNRHGEWLDFLANAFGAILSVLFWRLVQGRKA